jgi:hypothetical protein
VLFAEVGSINDEIKGYGKRCSLYLQASTLTLEAMVVVMVVLW